MLFKLDWSLESPGELVKPRTTRPTPRVSDYWSQEQASTGCDLLLVTSSWEVLLVVVWKHLRVTEMRELVMHREAWRAAFMGSQRVVHGWATELELEMREERTTIYKFSLKKLPYHKWLFLPHELNTLNGPRITAPVSKSFFLGKWPNLSIVTFD